MRIPILAAVLIMAAAFIYPAAAHHPGKNLDKVMSSKEKFFQAIDKPAPNFTLLDGDGNKITLKNFSDKIIVLHFVYVRCPDICPLHAEKLADIQAMINQTSMKDMVEFISITTDPSNDTPEILEAYGPNHGLDAVNWMFLTVDPDADEGATRALAETYGHKFTKVDDEYQAHGVVTHIIDRRGRWAANFHGLRFGPVNMVLYINGLTNSEPDPK